MSKNIQKWLHFLLAVNDESRNKELLTRYFFERFAPAPNLFLQFIVSFKNQLEKKHSPKLQKLLAKRYLDILSGLCERFGFLKIKHHLDDVCFQLLHPKTYQTIDKLLGVYKKKSDALVSKIINVLKTVVTKKGYRCHVKGRYKNIYSIYRKIQKKHKKNVLSLNDIFAFRIIIKKNDPQLCFEILNLLHDTFLPVASFFKDYITIPKVNGYQSLHAGLNNVIPEMSLPIEVQIRTQAMDDFAEKGIAAHWMYARTKKAKLISEKEQKLLQYLSQETSPLVYFFSYKGDLFSLNRESTALDFAYHIHTELGHRTKSVLANKRQKSVSYKIQEGDSLKLITHPQPCITKKSLAYVSSQTARQKIISYLKHHAKHSLSPAA